MDRIKSMGSSVLQQDRNGMRAYFGAFILTLAFLNEFQGSGGTDFEASFIKKTTK